MNGQYRSTTIGTSSAARNGYCDNVNPWTIRIPARSASVFSASGDEYIAIVTRCSSISGGKGVARVTWWVSASVRAISSARTPGPERFCRSGSCVTMSTRDGARMVSCGSTGSSLSLGGRGDTLEVYPRVAAMPRLKPRSERRHSTPRPRRTPRNLGDLCALRVEASYLFTRFAVSGTLFNRIRLPRTGSEAAPPQRSRGRTDRSRRDWDWRGTVTHVVVRDENQQLDRPCQVGRPDRPGGRTGPTPAWERTAPAARAGVQSRRPTGSRTARPATIMIGANPGCAAMPGRAARAQKNQTRPRPPGACRNIVWNTTAGGR